MQWQWWNHPNSFNLDWEDGGRGFFFLYWYLLQRHMYRYLGLGSFERFGCNQPRKKNKKY